MFTINRDNYETWLMLYLDNELSASERKAVEAFCTTNPDVQDELNGLKEVMLQPDLPVSMPGKERLLMPEIWNEEALTRQQHQLLMLADNELPEGDKVLLENELETNPLLQKEWTVLQKTVLEVSVPDEMPGKESLFRREKARLIPFGRVLRIAAAATIIGFGWFFTQQILNNTKGNDDAPELVVTGNTKVSPLPQVNTIDSLSNKVEPFIENNGVSQKDVALVNAEENIQAANKKPVLPEQEKTLIDTRQDVVLVNNTTENKNDLTNRDIVTKIPSVTIIDIPGVDAIETPIVTQTVKVENVEVSNEPQTMKAYEVVDADDVDTDESISIAGARISKQKIRSVYRNITRPLARTFDKTPAPRTEIR